MTMRCSENCGSLVLKLQESHKKEHKILCIMKAFLIFVSVNYEVTVSIKSATFLLSCLLAHIDM